MSATNIVEVWDSATDAQMVAGLNWYREAHETAHALAGKYHVAPSVAAGILAAMSPNTSWVANVMLAENVLAGTPKGLTNGLRKCERMLAGEEPEDVLHSEKYLKVSNFYLSIITHGAMGVTIDRHAWDVYTGTRHTDKADSGSGLPIRPRVYGKRYVEAMEAYREAARILSEREGETISAGTVQSVTWVVWRARYWAEGAFEFDGSLDDTRTPAQMALDMMQ
jgi:hypothetical protein